MINEGSWTRQRSSAALLENAVSVASMLLTTEAIVAEIPEEKSAAPAMPAGMDY